MMILPYLVTIGNIGITFRARTHQLELTIPYRLVTCPSHVYDAKLKITLITVTNNFPLSYQKIVLTLCTQTLLRQA